MPFWNVYHMQQIWYKGHKRDKSLPQQNNHPAGQSHYQHHLLHNLQLCLNNAMAFFWITLSMSSWWNKRSAITSYTILALMNTLRWLADSRCVCEVFPKATGSLEKNTSLPSALIMLWNSSHFSSWAVERYNLYPSVWKVEKYFTFWFWPFCH